MAVIITSREGTPGSTVVKVDGVNISDHVTRVEIIIDAATGEQVAKLHILQRGFGLEMRPDQVVAVNQLPGGSIVTGTPTPETAEDGSVECFPFRYHGFDKAGVCCNCGKKQAVTS